jgi:hypothetical protein
VGRIGRGIGPDESNQSRFAIQCVGAEKLAASVLELADLGWEDGATLAVCPIEAPLLGLRIEETKGETFDVAGNRAIGFELLQLSPAIPTPAGQPVTEQSLARTAARFRPPARAILPLEETPNVSLHETVCERPSSTADGAGARRTVKPKAWPPSSKISGVPGLNAYEPLIAEG